MNLTLINNPDNKDSATTLAYNRLRGLILSGELAPGEKLKIGRLRDVLDTGASPIREALSQLVSDQLVVRHDQRGFQAAATSLENFEEILDLRCTLEAKALRSSVLASTTLWEESLVLAHHRLAKAAKDQSGEFERLHKDFHMALISNCNAPLLRRYCSQLYDLNIRYRHVAARSTNYKGRNVEQEHLHIMDAVISKNVDQAVDLLTLHYIKTGEFLKPFID